ncbi:MAG TPA: Hsp70 family protein [Myxococcaceae bacterium]|nr:Hsp70 family protein [Myxococcaceae bacterium]
MAGTNPSLVLGIDFGTTNTAACFFDRQGKLRLVPVREKVFTLPSVVWFRSADKAVVGHAARMQIIDDPRNTVHGSKRFLGRRFQSEFVARHKDRFAYQLTEGADGLAAVEIYGQILPLADVVAHVLRTILDHANHVAGERFRECVLTVPTHAGIRQRDAVRQAAAKVGLRVRALVNEPTAAALYYANLRNPEQQVLVFDLGGGTFDATLMSVKNRAVQVSATGGDAFLGGADFDRAIVDSLMMQFERKEKMSLRSSNVAMQRLVFATEGAKIALSTQEEVRLRVPCVAERDGQFVDFDFQLQRAQVENMVAHLIERTAGACDEVLERALTSAEYVDELVLVGGQTRMPAIRRRFQHFKRTSTEGEVHPDLAVAIGAAVLGRNLGRGSPGLQDVVPMPISALFPGGRTHEVIPTNTPVPASKRLAIDDLPVWSKPIPIVLLESVDELSIEREALGTVNVPPEWRKAQMKGLPALELSVGQDFALTARLISATGTAINAPIAEVRPGQG